MRGLLALLLCLWTLGAQAHRPSDAFLSLRVDGAQMEGHWEIALRDLAVIADLDTNRNRELSWGELRLAQADLFATLSAALSLRADGRNCALHFTDLLINERSDGRYAWFALRADCPAAVRKLDVEYRLLFAVDPTHRGLLVLEAKDFTHTAVLGPDSAARSFELTKPSALATFRDYVVQGVWHIVIGYDHILFLLALLLPAVLRYEQGRWQAQPHLRPVLWNVFGVVTAFTLAHSITLSLAALNWVSLPGWQVESAIAASVLLAALNNIWPMVMRARGLMAFAFGLIHGFGFASVLGDLGLPADLRVLSLLAFNLGVELGQLVIVLLAVPVAFAIRRTAFYRTGVRVGGSAAVALLALWWLGQRLGLLLE
ncbi:MAG: HupE/UreJ family protein [Panacagrimonas sp.]